MPGLPTCPTTGCVLLQSLFPRNTNELKFFCWLCTYYLICYFGCVTLHPRIFHPFTFILGFSSSGFFILGFFILSIFIPALSSSHFHPHTFILALSSSHIHPRTFILGIFILALSSSTFSSLAFSSSHFHPRTFLPTFSSLLHSTTLDFYFHFK